MKVNSSSKTSNLVVELAPGERAPAPIASPELRLRHILVPVDFSDSSRKAFEFAVSLAKHFGAEIQLLHVVEVVPPPPDLMIVADTEALAAETREEAAKRLSEWRQDVGSSAVAKATVRVGNPHREIVQAADETNTDLIVLGTHGRSGLARLLTGSTAEHVVRHAPCPVLVVRAREHVFLTPAEEHKRIETA